jgi:putative copper export protein
MAAEPLIIWSDPVREYVGFIAQFLALGSVGFHLAAVRGRDASVRDDAEQRLYADASQRAALIGLPGIIVQSVMFALSLPKAAGRAHTTVSGLLSSDLPSGAAALLFVVAIIGLALAAMRKRSGWTLALVGAVAAPLTGVLAGQWSRLVNPVHRVVAGLWIGTLFVLVIAGLGRVLREEATRERRGAIAADMVNGFSPLALTCGMIVVLSGSITAWTHLNPFSSLWSTPYGYALMTKLCLVAVVFALGAWNWKRVTPTLGSEDAAHSVRRSSRSELTAAALVLVATAILISLPSPRPPGPPPGATPGAGPSGAPAGPPP